MTFYQELIDNKQLLRQAAIVFGDLMCKLNPNESSVEKLNDAIIETIEIMELSSSESRIVNIFFVSYLGLLVSDKMAASEFVQSMIHDVYVH